MNSIKKDNVLKSYQDRLITFVKLKDKFIFKETGIHYINKKDIDDIKTWSETICGRVYKVLSMNIIANLCAGLKDSTCIWCIKLSFKGNYLNAEDECPGCFYGENHGYCDSGKKTALYEQLLKTGVISILTNELYKSWIGIIEEKSK